jgi:hypothetical protein
LPGTDVGALWTGKPLVTFLHEGEAALELLLRTRPGARSSAAQILIQAGPGRVRRASLRAFILPQLAPSISCSIAYEGPAIAVASLETPPLMDAETFMADAARVVALAPSLSLAFLDIRGLEDLAGSKRRFNPQRRMDHRLLRSPPSATPCSARPATPAIWPQRSLRPAARRAWISTPSLTPPPFRRVETPCASCAPCGMRSRRV